MSWFRRKQCGTCIHFTPKYPQAHRDSMDYKLGTCYQITHPSDPFLADFAGPNNDPLLVGRGFFCCKHSTHSG